MLEQLTCWQARLPTAIAVTTLVVRRGLRQHSLSRSGAAAAAVMGVVHMTCSWTAGAMLLTFFFSCSKVTRYRQEVKARLDAHVKPGGQRNATQVLCNSAGGAAAALVAAASPALLHGWPELVPLVQLAAWSALLGHYACCCADTWASELGMLAPHAPRLITQPGRAVPAGVNGGVTPLGLAASAAGGLAMGASLAAWGFVSGELRELQPLISSTLHQHHTGTQHTFPLWLALGLITGLAGSLADSLMGATLQFSGYCCQCEQVVSAPGDGVKHIAGRPLLSNDAVNAAAAALTSVGAAALALGAVQGVH